MKQGYRPFWYISRIAYTSAESISLRQNTNLGNLCMYEIQPEIQLTMHSSRTILIKKKKEKETIH